MTNWRFKWFLIIVFITPLVFGCRTTDMLVPDLNSTQLEANKRTVRQLFESVWNEAKFVGLDQLWVQKVPFHFRGQAHTVGPEGVRNQVESWRSAFPDFRFVVEDVIAEDDRVAIRVRFTGTHTGSDWFGVAATGKSIDATEMMFFRLKDGRVVEAWEDYDEYAMRRQIGALK